MTMTMPADACANCYHPKENHPGEGQFCTRELNCMCQNYVVPELYAFALRVEKEKHDRKGIYKRVKFMLEEIPPCRNSGEKTFFKIYIEIWHGFKIRKKTPQVMDTETWNRMPNQDTVNREKRRVKMDHPELGTYSPQVKMEQTAIYQALLEMSAEQ